MKKIISSADKEMEQQEFSHILLMTMTCLKTGSNYEHWTYDYFMT